MSASLVISEKFLTVADIVDVACYDRRVELSPDPAFRRNIEQSREVLSAKLAQGEVIYGVNTGFGGNAKYVIPDNALAHHQKNLLEFLACGVGNPLPREVVRAAMLLRANALARGLSGVRVEIIERLCDLLHHNITPVVPEYGSVGASGDLCPSAYIARVLCGRGDVVYEGMRMTAAEALALTHVPRLHLEAKEGLALLNGTTFMTGMAALVVDEAAYLFDVALRAIAMAVEALSASPDYFAPEIHRAKHHPGQIAVAQTLCALLEHSGLTVPLDDIRHRVHAVEQKAHELHDVVMAAESIQSPYSIRCVPQGLGPMWETLEAVRAVIEREANSVNDNPQIDPETGRVYHTGNFYGGHIARAMDGLKLDMANLANWLHAIAALLMDDRFSNGLPPSLSPHPGIFQGFKGMQLVHTSLVTHIRHAASSNLVHTLPTEQFNQDMVSLGMHAADSAWRIATWLRTVMAITLLATAQAVDLRKHGFRSGQFLGMGTRPIYEIIRGASAYVEADRALEPDIRVVSQLIVERKIPIEKVNTKG